MINKPRFGLLGAALFGATALWSPDALAAECWQVIGWDSTDYVGAQALLQPADCTTIPDDFGWVHIPYWYGSAPNDDLYLRVHNDDPRIGGDHVFEPILVFSAYDGSGTPEVFTDLIPAVGFDNEMDLSPLPPEQGVPNAGARVRLRHRQTGNCIYSQATNGAQARNRPCWFDSDQTYVLDDTGNGYFRLRNEDSNQCLYAAGGNGGKLHNWGCWSDPNMEFALDPATNGYRLRHRSSSNCAYGTSTYAGNVHHWGCWSDPNMEYWVDIIDYGGWTAWLDRDNPGGSGDWETLGSQTGVCASPTDVQCRATNGTHWTLTGETLNCTVSNGLWCVNSQQSDGWCQDYEVRFLCP